jgi:hypothetical protein
MRCLRSAAAALSAVLATGCYSYLPIESDAMAVGSRVRIVAASGESIRPRSFAGEPLHGAWSSAEGVLSQIGTDTLALLAPRLVARSHDWEPGSEIMVPREAGQRVQRHQFDTGRTVLAFGIPATLMAMLVHGISNMSLNR